MKYDIKPDKCNHAFCLCGDDDNSLFICGEFGDISIKKDSKPSNSYCYQYDGSAFDYRSIKQALVERPHPKGSYFGEKRIIVVQMK